MYGVIEELDKENTGLKKRVSELEEVNAELKKRIVEIKKENSDIKKNVRKQIAEIEVLFIKMAINRI